jgi:aminoglycoside phosphotransferase (APT) family kinase protein
VARVRSESPPAGIDAEGVTGWFSEHVPAARAPLSFEQIPGGRSNLSYKVTDDAGRTWVLRRPPLHGVLGSAHDMAREQRVIAALDATDVPVPSVAGLSEDDAVNGAPFFVMDFVDGLVLREEEEARAAFDERERERIADSLVDALAAIHAVDPDAAGLAEHGRRDGYVERQLRRWHGQWEQARTRDLPTIDDVHRSLGEHVPEQGPATIVHGDYRLDNVILSPAGDVRAVLDWELSTLGDPLADLGLLLVYWVEADDRLIPLRSAPSRLPGFPTRRELADRYAERSGRDIDQLDYYVALGRWKLAIVLEGVYSRHRSGAYGDSDQGYDDLPAVVEGLAEGAHDAVARLRG